MVYLYFLIKVFRKIRDCSCLVTVKQLREEASDAQRKLQRFPWFIDAADVPLPILTTDDKQNVDEIEIAMGNMSRQIDDLKPAVNSFWVAANQAIFDIAEVLGSRIQKLIVVQRLLI